MAVRVLACGAACLVINRRQRRRDFPVSYSTPFIACDSVSAPSKPIKCETVPDGNDASSSIGSSLRLPRSAFIRKNTNHITAEYDLKDDLGDGAYATVIQATSKHTGLERAIKVIPKSKIDPQMFEIELHSLMELDHPHIVKILQYFETAECFAIAMELCNGPDLIRYIAKKAVETKTYVPEEELSIILRQILKAILACHEHNVIHRDVKPDNFMITGEEMTVKMIDFGLAYDGEVADGTSDDATFGTYRYMAPEVFARTGYNRAVDLWSLGVCFYTMLTFEHLLPDDGHKEVWKFLKNKNWASKKISTCKYLKQRSISKDARDLLTRLLAYDPAKRITAEDALHHPFVTQYAKKKGDDQYEHNLQDFEYHFDHDLVCKLEKFSKAPRLRRITLLALAHLVSQQPFSKLQELRQTFRCMDSHGTGQLTLEDVKRALKRNKIDEPSNLEETFAICDSAGNGGLNFNEFIACMFPESLITPQLCAAAFRVLNRSGNGALGPADIKLLYASGGAAEHTCPNVVKEATGKEKLNLEEFQKYMTSPH